MAKAKKTETKETTQQEQEVSSATGLSQEQIDAGNKQLEQLTVNDLLVIKNVFTVCSQRGAFKAEEFSTIGPVYTKLNNFLKVIMPPKPAEGESAEEPKAEEETQGES